MPLVEGKAGTDADAARLHEFLTSFRMMSMMLSHLGKPGDVSLLAQAFVIAAGEIAATAQGPLRGAVIEHLQAWLHKACLGETVTLWSTAPDPDGGVPYIPTPIEEEPDGEA